MGHFRKTPTGTRIKKRKKHYLTSDYSNAQCYLPKYCNISQTRDMIMPTLHDLLV